MNLIRSFFWTLYNRFLSTIGFALGLAVAGAGIWYRGVPAVEAYMNGAPLESLIEPAAISAGGVVAGFYVWRFVSAMAFHRTVVGAAEKRVKKHSGTAQVKSAIIDQFDEQFEELKSDLQQTRKTVQGSDVSEIRESVEELEQAVRELEEAVETGNETPNHETIPDSRGTEQRPDPNVQPDVVDTDREQPVSVPGRGDGGGTGGTDDRDGFGSNADDGDGFGSGAEDGGSDQGGFGSGTDDD